VALFRELPEGSLGRDHTYGVKPIDLTLMAVLSWPFRPRRPRRPPTFRPIGLRGSIRQKALRSE